MRRPRCGYELDDVACNERGAHFCVPRSLQATLFFEEGLTHTKGRWARRPFIPTSWQRDDIIRPIFGWVLWDDEWGCYRRQCTDAWLELGRKNGKSELDAGFALKLTCADDEESAEVYGCACDVPQARKVFDVALRMVQLSPTLSRRLTIKESARRIIDERTASYYEVVPADAAGNLGHNPHGAILDEVITQPDGRLWEAMTTAAGARVQPLFVRSTTAGNDPASWAAKEHEEAERVLQDPKRAPHRFVYMRNTPKKANPWDESNWAYANPALGEFLSIGALRREAVEARNDPTKENAFRQFRLNQWVQQVTRFIPLDLWDANIGEIAPNPQWLLPKLKGKPCSAGLDLSSKLDLTAWCLLFDDGWSWWRFWVPESVVPTLDKGTGGQFGLWVRDGWVTATEGDVIDYDVVYGDIEADCSTFTVADGQYDRWSGEPVRQEIKKRTGLDLVESETTYARMTPALKEFMRLLKGRELAHGGNPVARWMADNLEVRSPRDNPEMLRPVKPNRDASDKRIDGMPALLFAVNARVARLQLPGTSVGVW